MNLVHVTINVSMYFVRAFASYFMFITLIRVIHFMCINYQTYNTHYQIKRRIF